MERDLAPQIISQIIALSEISEKFLSDDDNRIGETLNALMFIPTPNH